MGDKAATALFEETQRSDYRDRWWKVLAAVLFVLLGLFNRDYMMAAYGCLISVGFFRPMTTHLTSWSLCTAPWSLRSNVPLNMVVCCEVVDYRMNFWGGAIAAGMDFPSQSVRARGTRGVRLDVTDGLHLLIGSQEPEKLAALIVAHASACRVDTRVDALPA